MRRFLLLLTLMGLLLAACGAPMPNTEATGHVVIVATQTAQPTDTPTLTSIPVLTPTSTWTPTPTDGREPTDTPTPTSTPTPIPTYALSGVVFFDYNGNGVQDGDEPPISGATVQVGSLTAVSTPDGSYSLEGVPRGQRAVTVSAEGFRHISLSSAAFQPSDRPVSLTINGDTERNWGLMQGFLTLPFKCCPSFSRSSPFGMTGMFDVDRRVGHVRSYDPDTVRPDFESNGVPPWAYDQHDGIDYCFPVGTEIVAAAPGIVKVIEFEPGGAGNLLVIHHPYEGKQTLYAHLSETLVGNSEQVARGQPIALSGNSGVSDEPHLHFRLATWETPPQPIDPYRDLTEPESVSYWTVDNNPQYPGADK